MSRGPSDSQQLQVQLKRQSDHHEVEILDVTRGSLVQAGCGRAENFFGWDPKKPAKYISDFYIFSTYFVRDIGISPDILRYPLLISNGSFHFGLALECR